MGDVTGFVKFSIDIAGQRQFSRRERGLPGRLTRAASRRAGQEANGKAIRELWELLDRFDRRGLL